MSRRTVINTISRLSEIGLLSKETRFKDNKQTTSVYTLVGVQNRGAADAPGGVQQVHGGGAAGAPRTSQFNLSVEEPNGSLSVPKKPTRTKIAYPDDFETFWKAYPTDPNMSKKEALDCWKKLSDEDRQKAIASVPAFQAYCRKTPDYRTLHACRYLSKRRFDGFAEAATPPSQNQFPKISISVHDQPELFDKAVSWAERHDKFAIRHGQEHINIPENVAENLRNGIRRTE